MPEVKKEDIKINLQNDVLTISGERKQEKKQENENELRVESCYGAFSRSFVLPSNVDASGIRAESRDGVLRVHIPKAARAQAKAIPISVQ